MQDIKPVHKYQNTKGDSESPALKRGGFFTLTWLELTLCNFCSSFVLLNAFQRFFSFPLSFRVPLERDNSEEFLKREARATQLAEEIESSAQYKARVALENDERTEEEKYTAVQRNASEREGHGVNTRYPLL